MPRISLVPADSGWIMEEFARQLASRIPGAKVNIVADAADLIYFLPYSAWKETASGVTVALFTHLEQVPAARQRFFEVARKVDYCVTMAARYEHELRRAGIDKVRTITPGVDLALYTPRIKVGVVGRTYHTGRKGEAIVLDAMKEPGVDWHFTGEGWPGPAQRISPEKMPDFYRAMDYIVVPSLIEGGPMCVLEALACGCEVIAPDVGFVTDYPHIPFELGNPADLRRVLRERLARRKALAAAVQHRTWAAFAREHERLFQELIPASASSSDFRSPSIPSPRNAPHQSKLNAALVLHDSEAATKGGPGVRGRRTVAAMQNLGIAARLMATSEIRRGEVDVAHVFNVWPPHESLATIGDLFRHGPPIVFSPIFLDLRELRWATPRLRQIFSLRKPSQKQDALNRLASLRDGAGPEADRHVLTEMPEHARQVRQMIEMADVVIYLSEHERQCLLELGTAHEDAAIVRNGVNTELFRTADPRLFQERYGVSDYVLCAGRLEMRKNQLLLAEALRDTGLPVVFLGAEGDSEYAQLVKANAGPNARFIDYIQPDSELLASAFAGCRVFALPSFCEGAPLAALEAGAAGARLVLSNRSGEREYFGALAEYCDPTAVRSIRESVLLAFESASPTLRQQLQDHVADRFDIQQHAAETIEVYRRAIERARRRIADKPFRADRPIYLDVTSIAHARGQLTGMYRTELMVTKEFVKRFPDRVKLCMWNGQYLDVPHDDFLSGAYRHVVQREIPSDPEGPSPEADSPLSRSDLLAPRRWINRLPHNIQSALRNARRAYGDSLYVTYRATTYPARALIRRLSKRLTERRGTGGEDAHEDIQPSIFDRNALFFTPGSGWVSNERYASDLIRAVRENDLRLAAIVYDLLPVDYPEHVLDRNVRAFAFGFSHLLRRSDLLFTISEYTQRRLQAHAAGRGFALPRIKSVRLGEDIVYDGPQATSPENEVLKKLESSRFVAFVSTINPRKNHALIYRVWQRLQSLMPERVPKLVFVGAKGWESNDFLALLGRNTEVADLIHVTGAVSEADLDWAYRHCLFTVYPSLAEGWGLPIAESLMYRKVCVCSNATAMSEIGHGLTISLDPLDAKAWIESLLALIENDDAIRHLEARIASEYEPMRWTDTAAAIWNEIQSMLADAEHLAQRPRASVAGPEPPPSPRSGSRHEGHRAGL